MSDNYAQQLSTDNYLEKYLPFRIQGMLSESLFAFLEDVGGPALLNYKKHEAAVFKTLHRVVIDDDGRPSLKKKAFVLPGYKKIIDLDEVLRQERIDNVLNNLEQKEYEHRLEESRASLKQDILIPAELNESPFHGRNTLLSLRQRPESSSENKMK